MIFTPPLARAVATGRKTQTRRPVKGDKPCRYQAGHSYAVQPGRGKEAIARLRVLDVHDELAGDITFADARREGFRTTLEFKAAWVSLYDKAWLDGHNDDAIEATAVQRFDERHAGTPVWVITFTLDRDHVRLLARPTRTSGDYTDNHRLAIDDLEVIDPAAGYIERVRAEGEKQRAAFRRDLETERQRRRNLRPPMLHNAA